MLLSGVQVLRYLFKKRGILAINARRKGSEGHGLEK
jgi:hypothetical protein